MTIAVVIRNRMIGKDSDACEWSRGVLLRENDGSIVAHRQRRCVRVHEFGDERTCSEPQRRVVHHREEIVDAVELEGGVLSESALHEGRAAAWVRLLCLVPVRG